MRILRIIGSPLYQWEVGRQLEILLDPGVRVNFVQFCHLGEAESLVVEPKTENGMTVVDVPNILLQSGNNVVAYAVSVSTDCVETVHDCVFSVTPRPKPSDYVYTETEVRTYESLAERIEALEQSSASEESIKQAVSDYLDAHPIEESDPTVPEWAKNPEKPQYSAEEVGAVANDELPAAIEAALAQAKASGEFKGEPGEPGQPGYTPQKGIDYFDGAPGADYQLTPEDKTEIAEMAAGLVEVPEAPEVSMKPLTFTGAVNATYDGSEEVTVEIPQGGGGSGGETFEGGFELLVEHTVTADEASVKSFKFTQDKYPLIKGQKTLLLQVSKPASVSTPWWNLKAGNDIVIMFGTATFSIARGMAIALNNTWLSNTNTGTNPNLASSMPLAFIMQYGGVGSSQAISIKNIAYNPYTSLELYSYTNFLEEGTIISIYGGK